MKTRTVSLVTAVPLLLVLAGPVAAADPTWVGIGGPEDWQPKPGFTLEIGSKAWTITAQSAGGVTSLELSAPTIVRVRRLSDCVPVVRFVAQPGRLYFIRFAANGTARVEDWTAQGMDAGPGMGAGGPLVCPRLPDTSTATGARPGTSMVALAVAIGLGVVTTLIGLSGRSRPR